MNSSIQINPHIYILRYVVSDICPLAQNYLFMDQKSKAREGNEWKRGALEIEN